MGRGWQHSPSWFQMPCFQVPVWVTHTAVLLQFQQLLWSTAVRKNSAIISPGSSVCLLVSQNSLSAKQSKGKQAAWDRNSLSWHCQSIPLSTEHRADSPGNFKKLVSEGLRDSQILHQLQVIITLWAQVLKNNSKTLLALKHPKH